MSKKYKVIITPMEPYTLGTEQGSKYEGVQNNGRESYIIGSSEVPEQTTILGTLRYIVLLNKGILKSNFKYDQSDYETISNLIGKSSFSFEAVEQSFGIIEEISPIFIQQKINDREVKIFVRNPFCNKSKYEYSPYQLETEETLTSRGNIKLPGQDYDVKKGFGRGYICIQDKKVIDDLFVKKIVSGNKKDNTNDNKKEGFYKREMILFNPNYDGIFSFGVYVKAEENAFPDSCIAYMGRKKSAFRFEFEIVDDNETIENAVEEAFATNNSDEVWYYALSDLYVPEFEYYDSFAIILNKTIRNLETNVCGNSYTSKRSKSKKINLISEGSVFKEMPYINENNCKKAGYNSIVKLGGNSK